MNSKGQILGHNSFLVNCVDANLLEVFSEAHQLVVVVHPCSVHETSRPCKDAGNAVGRCFVAFLVLAVMSAVRHQLEGLVRVGVK